MGREREAVPSCLRKNKALSHKSMDFCLSWFYQGFKYGLYAGVLLAGLDTFVLRNRAPWTLSHHAPDHLALEEKQKHRSLSNSTYPH